MGNNLPGQRMSFSQKGQPLRGRIPKMQRLLSFSGPQEMVSIQLAVTLPQPAKMSKGMYSENLQVFSFVKHSLVSLSQGMFTDHYLFLMHLLFVKSITS